MGCSKCGTSTCSGSSCASGTAYYNSADVCEEDNCKKIYCNQFTFGVCPDVSWNVPSCGQTALLSVPGVQGASIGSYIWHTAYGYFQVVSVDADKGLLGVVNTCLTGNADPGTQIPKCTCFTVSPPPADVAANSELFPYVAIDFTAPADSTCLAITVTTISGLSVGDIISIGSGFYEIDSFISDTVINICNTGDGILPGTSVIAQDSFGIYQYPIFVTSSCCTTLGDAIDDLSALAFSYEPVAVTGAIAAAASRTVGGGNVFAYTNTSATRTMQILVVYSFISKLEFANTSAAIDFTIETNENGAGWVNINPMPAIEEDLIAVATTSHGFTITEIYTIAPTASLTVQARATVANGGPDGVTASTLTLQAKGIVVRVN